MKSCNFYEKMRYLWKIVTWLSINRGIFSNFKTTKIMKFFFCIIIYSCNLLSVLTYLWIESIYHERIYSFKLQVVEWTNFLKGTICIKLTRFFLYVHFLITHSDILFTVTNLCFFFTFVHVLNFVVYVYAFDNMLK